MAETVFLRRLSRWQADQQREAVADLYVAAYRDVPGEAPPDRDDFLRRFAADVQRPAFDMVIGSAGGALVACAYGFRAEGAEAAEGADAAASADPAGGPGGAGGAEGGARRTDRPGRSEAPTQVFTVAELTVLPTYRHRGVAASMLERLFARTDAPVALARVSRANTAARAAYRAWGWQHTGPTSADPDARDLWIRRLRG
ncbi:GNAT family N-acetyltransferase [Streptomyces sp.]|uniref:GNAT family N-acetyltransferase n=1 Tax=Streptomyces sp. TaxID=1931 RepID=UPI002F40D1F5